MKAGVGTVLATAFRSLASAWDNWIWDRQIARDARNGRLDRLARNSEMEIRQGKVREL
jgi:hypothetical protein